MRIGILDVTHPVLAQRLGQAGHTCINMYAMPGREHEQALPTLDGIVVRSRSIDRAFLERCPNVKFIGRVGAGMENIDAAACRKRGIHLMNSPEGNRDGVGESCVMLLLALMKSLVHANMSVRAGLWPREALRGTDLKGKTIGIIGFGQMGSAFAEKLRGFGVRILGHDKYRSGFARAGVEECGLEQLLRESDVISLHLPLNDGTRYYADQAFFDRLRNPVWFLNTSRGGVVRTSALLDAIDSGKVIAAALDVLEYERPELDGLDAEMDPIGQQRLLRHDRVLLTPHIAGVTHEGRSKMADVLATKILALYPHGTN
ncbi:MAG TPA: NAD(P)-dependent oxidoreductase [Flavobacteriales bacterium]|nr:NAD(P)-dependent oxidoreductase [Flavobacteriales bacterium]